MVFGVVECRYILLIFFNVFIKVSEDVFWFIGIDLEVELIFSVKLEGEFMEGEIIVFVKKLFDIICGIFEGIDIYFLLDGSKVFICVGWGCYMFFILFVNDYLNLEDWEGEVEFELLCSDLKCFIDVMSFLMV